MRIVVLHPLTASSARYGTEVVAQELAESWQAAGCEVTMVGHAADNESVRRTNVGSVPLIALPPLGPVRKWSAFRMHTEEAPGLDDALREVRPDVVFVVGLGPQTVNLRHLEVVATYGTPCALWHHVPGITCQQHGLRYKGRVPCDGKVIPQRCASCRLTAAGVPEVIADLASHIPIRGFEYGLPLGLDHVVAGRAMSEEFARYVAALPGHFDRVFVGADWVRKVLILNGFERQQIALVRPGLRRDLAEALDAYEPPVQRPLGPLRLIFWGRLDDTKGIDTTVLALRQLQGVPLDLNIVGGFDQRVPFHGKLACMAAGDPRIHFAGRLESRELAPALRCADVAVIPSPWPETGPLTVFEARAAGLPILGARMGGIAETCAGDPSARLFEPNDHIKLAKLIAELAYDRSELNLRRALVPRARTMADAAAETLRALQALVRHAKPEYTPVKSAVL